MSSEKRLLNPDGRLLPDIESRLVLARKTKPLWSKLIGQVQSVKTPEGTLHAEPGDYLCRGIQGEHWPQKAAKLQEKYSPSGEVDSDGWERFDPKPDSAAVEVARVYEPFRIIAQWGELTGKSGDYVVRSAADPIDTWIVDRDIFEASYELSLPGRQPTVNPELWKKQLAKEEARDAVLREENAGKPMAISQVEAFELEDILDEKGKSQ